MNTTRFLLHLLFLLFGLFVGAQTDEHVDRAVLIPDSNGVYSIVDQQPQFPGGGDSLQKYLKKSLHYKITDGESDDWCEVGFIVSEEGKIVDATLKRGLPAYPRAAFDALQVVKNMPDWIPATINDKKVPGYATVSVSFLFPIASCDPYENTSPNTAIPVDEPAQFPGGHAALKKYLAENLRYPMICGYSIEGKCHLRFTVTSEGKITDIHVELGVVDCPECDREAVRVVKNMPDWIPAKIDGVPVDAYFYLPVRFHL